LNRAGVVDGDAFELAVELFGVDPVGAFTYLAVSCGVAGLM
jgi:hypothetical protein